MAANLIRNDTKRSDRNLKSTVYNQNGQNYFEQLTAYNSMTIHLRRILLAKCVVDARNKSYVCKKKQMNKYDHCKSDFPEINGEHNEDSKLICNILHHTAVLKAYDKKLYQTNINNIIQTSTLISKTSEPVKVNAIPKQQHRHEEKSLNHKAKSKLQLQEVLQQDSSSSTFNMLQSDENCKNIQTDMKKVNDHEINALDIEAKYTKFIYNITQEMILNSLYTDMELQKVFKKYIEENKNILSMERMLHEIYQLKFALNMLGNSKIQE